MTLQGLSLEKLTAPPLISIVVPTYNQGPFIEDCLRSLQSQKHTHFEVIIQDSLSNDQTEEICRRYAANDPRFQYYREKDSGQTDGINRGLARSQGVLWTWLCSDDRYHCEHALSDLVLYLGQALKKNQGKAPIHGIYGKAYFISEDGKLMSPYHSVKKNLRFNDFHQTWPLSQPSSLLARESVLAVGGLDASLHLGMDLDLFLKVLKKGGVLHYANVKVADVRIQDNSKSVKYRKDTATTALTLIQKHFRATGDMFESAYAVEFRLSAEREEFLNFFRQTDGDLRVAIYHSKFRLKNFLNHAYLVVTHRIKYKLIDIRNGRTVTFIKRVIRYGLKKIKRVTP